MAWTTPRTWVAGELVTAPIGNTHWRDNFNALYGGVMSITAQAANDFMYFSSSTQIGRVAAVDGTVPMYTTAAGWAMVTLANNGDMIIAGRMFNH
mgnify:CR=1 FL=1